MNRTLSEKKTLVVYYSRTGNTRKVAEACAERLGADIEEIVDRKNRSGPIGWLTAGRDAGRRSLTEIEEPTKDPSGYNIVVVGSPVWNDSVSTPVRTYIVKNSVSFSRLAIFCTGDAEDNRALDEMEEIIGKVPLASMKLRRKRDIESGEYAEKIDAFVNKIILGKAR